MSSVSRRYAGSIGRFERPSGYANDELRAPVVLMVSGGADSTALLVMAATSVLDIDDGRGEARIAKERLHILHVNHQLRGMDAIEDEEYVGELASRYGIPLTVRRFDVAALAAESPDKNIENVGRELRYAAAIALANELSEQFGTPRSAARIVTAHNANDRAETFFMNAIRGSGAPGLASIPRRRNRIVRPLLNRTHAELCEYLRMRGIVWREDATNQDTRYLRSYVRHTIIPACEVRNPHVMTSLATTCDILQDEDAYLTAVSARVLRELTRRQQQAMIALDSAKLAATEVAIARRVVRNAVLSVSPEARLEARHIAKVLKLVAVGEGSASLPLDVDVRVEHGLLIIRSKTNQTEPKTGWITVPGSFDLSDGRILTAQFMTVEHGSKPLDLAKAHAQEYEGASVLVSADSLSIDERAARLWVDVAHPGDIMCPFGMHGQSKKLSDLLNEAALPTAERAYVPVIRTSPTGNIVWVAGIRLDERVKVHPDSKRLVELTLVDTRDDVDSFAWEDCL